MPKSFHLLTVHIIFSTKSTKRLLARPFRADFCSYAAQILRNMDCRSVDIGCVDDHVHVACNMTRKHAPAKVIEVLKKDTSRWIKTKSTSLRDFYWQTGYAIYSVSPSHAAALQAYVRNQEEHHKVETFEQEFVRLTRLYGLSYDERYIWD